MNPPSTAKLLLFFNCATEITEKSTGSNEASTSSAAAGGSMMRNGLPQSFMVEDILSSPSPTFSDSGSDELLSMVKKATTPYPQYQNMAVVPNLSYYPQQMANSLMDDMPVVSNSQGLLC